MTNYRERYSKTSTMSPSEFHEVCDREQKVGAVLGRLKIEPHSALGDLFAPGIRGSVSKGQSTDEIVKFFKPHATRLKDR